MVWSLSQRSIEPARQMDNHAASLTLTPLRQRLSIDGMFAAPRILADGEVEAIGWLLIILVIVVLLFVAVMFIRKHFRESDEASTTEAAPFALDALRDLLRQGKLTQEEYDRLRNQMVEKLKPNTLSLADIRRMLQNEEIGIDEYERLKAQIVASMKDPSIPYPNKPKPQNPDTPDQKSP